MGRIKIMAPLSAEVQAYTLARFSRSPDSIDESLAWVQKHDEQSFLDSYYFQYGHSSIADLGNVTLSFEGVSELAALEIVDDPLWNGQQKSTRYQDFSKCSPVIPPGLSSIQEELYLETATGLLEGYKFITDRSKEILVKENPRPDTMIEATYDRAITARAFDRARYLLFLGIPTNVGQTTSIRTLERQGTALLSSEYGEIQQIGTNLKTELQTSCPTLAKYLNRKEDTDRETLAHHIATLNAVPIESDFTMSLYNYDLEKELTESFGLDLFKYSMADYYNCCRYSEFSSSRPTPKLNKLRPYTFEIVMDIGGYRDLHRHRNCFQVRQDFSWINGYITPDGLDSDCLFQYSKAMEMARVTYKELPEFSRDYIIPFGVNCRSLFSMDLAEAAYIIKLRTGVKGHISYRRIVWDMRKVLLRMNPGLEPLLPATSPEIEEPLTR